MKQPPVVNNPNASLAVYQQICEVLEVGKKDDKLRKDYEKWVGSNKWKVSAADYNVSVGFLF